MKLLLLTLLFLLLLFTPAANAQIWYDQYTKVEYTCAICGASIYQNEKVTHGTWLTDNMGSFGGVRGEVIPDSLGVYGINFNVGTGKICRECYRRYSAEIATRMNKTWNQWLDNAIQENNLNRLVNEGRRRWQKKQEIDRRIEELKKERGTLK